jgi:hypothetical protein
MRLSGRSVTVARCLVAAILMVLVSLQPSSAASGQGAATKVVSDCSHGRIRPHRIIVACGDGGFVLRHLHYQRWGAFRAAGTGLAMTHNCIPSCAESTFESHPITFVFDRSRDVQGVRLFVHARVTYTGDRPQGSPRRLRFPLPRPIPFYMFDEDAGGRSGVGIDDSSVSTFTPGHLVVKLEGPGFAPSKLNAAEVFVDVDKQNPGPEYRLDYLFARDHDGHSGQRMARITRWSGSGTTVSCPRWRTWVDYATGVVTMDVPRRCLGSPAQLRVSVATWQVTAYGTGDSWTGYVDAVPAYHRFEPGGWIR